MTAESGVNAPRVLVTGGAGYLGSVLVARLLAENLDVRVLDNLRWGGESLLAFRDRPDFELQVGDIRNRADVERACRGVASVVHLAAIVGDPACAAEPELAQSTNGDGAALVLETALRSGVSRFVFASTCSNYGKMTDPDSFVDETSPLKPVSLYARLKVDFERRLMDLPQSEMTPVSLRFATAYGLSPRPRFDLTVNEFTRELTLRRRLEVFGESFWRPYCHTGDIAAAVVLALTAPADTVRGRAFNIGATSQNFQKKQLVDLILEEMPDRAPLVAYVSRSEDPRDYRVNFDRISRTLGFVPKRTVVDGITEIARAIERREIPDPDNPRYKNVL